MMTEQIVDEEKRTYCSLNDLPTEILITIFSRLPARQIIKSRQVCLHWKQIIDGLGRSDKLWQKYCKEDFKDTYEMVREKARHGIPWINIYKSLALWPKLAYAREIQSEFAFACNDNEEIKNFIILQNDTIGVHKKGAIIYYDAKSFKQILSGSVSGHFLRYVENENNFVVLSNHLQLLIKRKCLLSHISNTTTTFDNVKTFILVNDEVYYANLNDEIYFYKLDENNVHGTFITIIEEGVMSLGYSKNRLNVLTLQRNIYSAPRINYVTKSNIYDHELVFSESLDSNSNLIHQLIEYNFLEHMDWRIYTQWMYVLNHNIPESPISDIVTVRTYGDMIFIGTIEGVLSIYHAPSSSGKFDIDHAEPLKKYNFDNQIDYSVMSMCPIIQIDVLEIIDGHMILVAMPKKIVILYFTHMS